MNLSVKAVASLILVTSLLLSSHTQAALVEWTFSATVQDIDGDATGMADFGIAAGTVLSATYLLDDSVTGNLVGENWWYDGAVVDIDVSAGIFQASLDPTFDEFNTVVVRDQDVDAVAASAALIIGNGVDSTGGFLATQFVGSDGQLIDSTLFPSIPDFNHVDAYDSAALGGSFFSFQATVNGIFTTVTAEISSPQARFVPVPAPGALLLLGSGLLGAFGIGRRT